MIQPNRTITVSVSGAATAPAKTVNRGTSGPSNPARTIWPTTVIAIFITAIYCVGRSAQLSARQSWMFILLLLVGLFLYLGATISKRPLGILIGSRNVMSLSRFQIVAWSLVVLSAFLTIAFRRIMGGASDPLNIPMDTQLWALMGISTASLVGTPLILQNKATQNAHPDEVQSAAKNLGESVSDVDSNREGKLYANASIKDARLTDMFEGDEIGNTAFVDIAKVQMFLFTMIIIVAYCYQVYSTLGQTLFDDHGKALLGLDGKRLIDTLGMPALSAGIVALLGISHAGYLTSKTADHTPTPA